MHANNRSIKVTKAINGLDFSTFRALEDRPSSSFDLQIFGKIIGSKIPPKKIQKMSLKLSMDSSYSLLLYENLPNTSSSSILDLRILVAPNPSMAFCIANDHPRLKESTP